jgi:hypothetical protein
MTAVVTRDGQIDEALSDGFTMLVADAQTTSIDPTGVITDQAVEVALTAARTWAGERAAARKADIERVHHEVIDTQLESLRLSHERRSLRVQTQLREAEQAGQASIRRMRAGQLGNLARQYEEKRRELASRRGVEVGHRIVGAGLLVEQPD